MNLAEQSVLILDCQTTSMRPGSGRILELAWLRAGVDRPSDVQAHLLIPDERGVPAKVLELTGLRDEDFVHAKSEREVFDLFLADWERDRPPVVIHYAQFEQAFLKDLWGRWDRKFDLDVLCSHRLARRLFPELPSQNIRALAGYFGWAGGDVKRSADHVRATLEIWRALVARARARGIDSIAEMRESLQQAPKPKATKITYRMDRLSRLNLSTKPGVYRMLAQDGRVLYVGKATSLRSRVNSYFRGRKGRDRRKLEMLARVWDIRVTECESPLEAALLETDEIKRLDPPYNVSLKAGERKILFYCRDFSAWAESQSSEFPVGPFRPMGPIESLRELWLWRRDGIPRNIFYRELAPDLMEAGFVEFCRRRGLMSATFAGQAFRGLIAMGLHDLKAFQFENDEDPETIFSRERAERDSEAELTADDIADKLERLFIRVGLSLQRSRRMTRLLNSDVLLESGRILHFRNGRIEPGKSSALASRHPWSRADIGDYDRISILLSEMDRQAGTVLAAT